MSHICTTNREGKNCIFMRKDGCSFSQMGCFPITGKCEGCDNVEKFGEFEFCKSYAFPHAKWIDGKCNMATHLEKIEEETKKKRNPTKAFKKGSRRKR